MKQTVSYKSTCLWRYDMFYQYLHCKKIVYYHDTSNWRQILYWHNNLLQDATV